MTVSLDAAAGSQPDLQQAWRAVPLPANAKPASGTDANLVVWQPSTDKMWEFWQLQHDNSGWHARWGGYMSAVSQNPGYYLPPHPNWGSTATSLPAIAGLITIDQLRAGHIDHALAVATPDACAGWFAWPAQRTDGSSADRNCLPEGAHLRLDPKLDLASLHLPPIALSIARAMQRYGIIIRDTTHSAFAFYAEDPTTGADPYDGPRGVFDGLQEWQFLPLIPWNRLQLLALARCSSVPCVSPRGPRR
ncbi:MAG: hypothetical protein JO169_06700 [Solirubrobacterales bacterium]|nr:hypothetical protein [Solirubrobacterales bacterium]